MVIVAEHVPDGKPPYRLTEEIIARSNASTWREAKLEWELSSIYFTEPDNPGTCLCGHYPIFEHCVLYNRENSNTAIVGNVCVNRFIGLPSENLFAAFRRIEKDRKASLAVPAVEYAFTHGWITEWERRFSLDTCRKRNLSKRQRAIRAEINAKVLRMVQGGHHA